MAGLSRCSVILIFAIFFCLSTYSEGREIIVGGKSGSWGDPSQQTESSLTQWAKTTRFLVGDTLVWDYESDKDSVLEVTKEAYAKCNTTSPIEEHKEGETKVKLSRPGPYYFISGAEGHCEKGQKVEVVVLSPRHHHHHSHAPAPSPSELGSPAVPPSSGAFGLRASEGVFVVGVSFVLFFFGL